MDLFYSLHLHFFCFLTNLLVSHTQLFHCNLSLNSFNFAFKRVSFFCLAKRKKSKKRLPPAACFLRFSPKWAATELGLRPQTVLTENPRFGCDARRGSRRFKVKPYYYVSPSPLGREGLGRGCHFSVGWNANNLHALHGFNSNYF